MLSTPTPTYTLSRTMQDAADGHAPPTLTHYGEFQRAFSFFNERLFVSQLERVPECLIVMTRKPGSHGYLAPSRWVNALTEEPLHELALNPLTLGGRSAEDVLSTLVHEMTHAWQCSCSEKPPRKGYHNREWAEGMEAIGLIPSNNGQEGGKQTGQKMTHYIEAGGEFQRAAALLTDIGWTVPYLDVPGEKKKKISRPKYICPDCGIKTWGKSGLQLACMDCSSSMEEEKPPDEEGVEA